MRSGPQPVTVGFPEKPCPGSDGRTRWNASSAVPPCAVGLVSGSITSSISITEPGQPWVMSSGNAFSCLDCTWMKWMLSPSISVVNCGSAFSLVSTRRRSYSVPQYCVSACTVASCTPCDASATSSLLGERVAVRRWRSSSRSSCGTVTWNGRTAVWVMAMLNSLLVPCRLTSISATTAFTAQAYPEPEPHTLAKRQGVRSAALVNLLGGGIALHAHGRAEATEIHSHGARLGRSGLGPSKGVHAG